MSLRLGGRNLSVLLAATLMTGCASSPPVMRSPAVTSIAVTMEDLLPEYRAAIREAERIGLDLYHRDRAAWRTTDILMQLEGAPTTNGAGWVTTDLDSETHKVVYLQEFAGEFRAWGEANYHAPSDSITDSHLIAPPRALSQQETAQARAIRTASASDWLRCAESYNFVVRPADEEDSSIHVYLLPASASADTYFLSGYHDFSVSADGSEVVKHFSQTKGCAGATRPPAEGTLSALMTTHLTSPTPTAFHVFMNLNYGLPVYAMTVDNKLLWSVENGRIRPVSRQ